MKISRIADWRTAAWYHRAVDAVPDRNALQSRLVADALEIIAANVLTDRDSTRQVEHMGRLGGYTGILRAVVGPEPDPETNDLGMPTSTKWWRWQVAMDLVPQARLDLQIATSRLNRERDAREKPDERADA